MVGSWRPHRDSVPLVRSEVLSGPLVFTPNGEGYHFRAGVATGELIAGVIAGGAQEVASPMPVSWNHVVEWLGLLEGLRRAS